MNYWTDRFGMPDIQSYDQLRKHFDREDIKPFRGSDDKPFGKRKYSNRRMRMLPDETIELEYMGSPLVRWHPDKTVSVKAYPSKRQGHFDTEALPPGVSVGIGNRTGPLIYLFKDNGSRWMSWWIKDENNQDVRNPHIRVINGNDWVRLHYYDERWLPVDEAALEPFEWLEPDKSRTRKVSAEYNIPALVNAARAMIGLDAHDGIGTELHRWGRNYKLAKQRDELLQCLKDQDFGPVLAHVRKTESRTYNHDTGRWDYEVKDISSSDVKALRDRLYVLTGICQKQQKRIVTLPEYHAIERRLKDFGQPE